MTPLPKRKLARARQGKRRKDIRLSLSNLVVCKKCGAKIKSHRVCYKCGYYNGKIIREIKSIKKSK